MNNSTILDPLNELFSLNNDNPVFDPDNQHTTYAKKVTLSDFPKTYTLNGNVVYGIADLRYNPETKEMLRLLKSKIQDEELSKFIQHISEEVLYLLQELKIEYIVQVPSSSNFLARVVSTISSNFNVPQASFLTLTKTPIHQLKFNKNSPQLEGMDRFDISEIKNQVMKHIQYQIEDDNEYLEAKRFPKNLLGFITGFFQVKGNVQELRGKRVLIIDDNLSSGNTMKDIVDMFSMQYGANTAGLVFFNIKVG